MWFIYKPILAFHRLILVQCLLLNTAQPLIQSPYAVKDNHTVPSGWEITARAPGEQQIHLQIGLKHGQFDELERHLYEVSDPYHHRYGQHLSAVEVGKLARPSVETEELVREWLLDHGIQNFSHSSAHDWINIHIPIRIAEILLDTKYYVYGHADDGLSATRCPSWSLPLHLHDHIEAIHPTNSFLNTKRKPRHLGRLSEVKPIGLGENGSPSYDELVGVDRTEFDNMVIPNIEDLPKDASPSQACNQVATSPVCLQTLYGTRDYVAPLSGKTHVGVVNFLDHVSNYTDVEKFLKRFRPDAVGASYQIQTKIVPHGPNFQSPVTEDRSARRVSLEANLDAQVLLGLAHPIPITAYNVGGTAPAFQSSQFTTENTNEPYLEWLQYTLAQSDLPQVISVSYADEEQTVPLWYAKRVCQGFAQLGARGVSVLFASGDEGVGADEKCFSNDGSNKPMFLPKFPASCPYVTAVGGTRNWEPEVVGFDARGTFVTGGGFSNYFSRPRFQDEVVNGYVSSLGTLHDGLYNKQGRGYPDISVRAYHYIVVFNGSSTIFDGTSASAPAAAAIFSLVNDALAAEGKPALGWLNPWLYSAGSKGFKDVVAGSNTGCNTAGFPAKQGWDAATGFGTPWFPTLKSIAEKRQYRDTKPWYMDF